ncbi:MAG: putative toxin-antitoxin system toxin component, PIN family [Candidatus Dormibacteria bacterium]
MRVVLDTNVLVSALHFDGRPRRVLEALLRGEHRLVTGPAILNELHAVLIETCGWDPARALAARGEVEALGDVVTPTDVPRVCRDGDDDQVLAIAVAGGAEQLVTGDAGLLALGVHHRIRIVTVAQFDSPSEQPAERTASR